MNEYLFTKYSDLDNYCKTNWCSISDIGKEFNCKVLTLNEYMDMEEIYVKSVIMVMEFMKIKEVEIRDIQKQGDNFFNIENFVAKGYEDLYDNGIMAAYNNLIEGNIAVEELKEIIKLQLRGNLKALVYVSRRLRLRVENDFKIYVTTSKLLEPILKDIMGLGLNTYVRQYWFMWNAR